MKQLMCVMVICIAVSCNSTTTTSTDDSPVADTPATAKTTAGAPVLNGVFTGTTPCADCPGIYTILEFLPDQEFREHLAYIDRNANFTDSGRWQLSDSIITVSFKNGGQDRYYKQISDTVIGMLDADKNPITGTLADFYLLKKKDTLINR